MFELDRYPAGEASGMMTLHSDSVQNVVLVYSTLSHRSWQRQAKTRGT